MKNKKIVAGCVAAERAESVVVVAAVIEHEGKVLIARRAGLSDPLRGCWEFPGGKVEQGEIPQDSLRREIREELGIEVEVGDFVEESVYPYPHATVHLLAYRCRWIGGTLSLSAHSAVMWLFPQDLLHYDLSPADRPIAEKILAFDGGEGGARDNGGRDETPFLGCTCTGVS